MLKGSKDKVTAEREGKEGARKGLYREGVSMMRGTTERGRNGRRGELFISHS